MGGRVAAPSTRDLSLLNVRDLLEEAASDSADSTLLVYDSREVSYGEFAVQVRAAASAWQALGVRKGDRVGFMLENCPEFLVAWMGLAYNGAILVAINTRWTPEEVGHFLNLTQPRFALIGRAHESTFSAARSSGLGIRQVVTIGTQSHWEEFLASGTTYLQCFEPVELKSSDEISFISTSGTTGRPKAVMQTHGNFVLTGEGYATWMGLQPGERLYLCLPLFHINSQAYTFMGAIAARASVVVVERFSASRFWSDMAKYDIDVFNYIGSMLAILLKADPSTAEQSHHVRLAYGGPALPGDVRAKAEDRFRMKFISGIGMSENTYGLIESHSGERRPGSLGKPRQHADERIRNEARVVDDQGNDVPADSIGELIFRNPVLMKGYYRDPQKTDETIRDGWLYTGDLVRRDSEGFFYFVDRKKDVIRVRGENVASAEVEEVLGAHESVLEAAVVAIPSELTEDDVAAFVVCRESSIIEPEELIAWAGTRLAPFKVPRKVWIVDSLPKTETQRVEKQQLRRMASQRLTPEQAPRDADH